MKKYRKKPLIVEAVQWSGNVEDYEEIQSKIDTITCLGLAGADRKNTNLFIGTLAGDMRCNPGDWIIKGIAGEYYPIKDDIFRATYEEVQDQEQAFKPEV